MATLLFIFSASLMLVLVPRLVFADTIVTEPSKFQHYFDSFVASDSQSNAEIEVLQTPNSQAYNRLQQIGFPFIDIPDKSIEKTYYFRWFLYQKHIRRVLVDIGGMSTSPYYVITEFLRSVSWEGKYSSISCAAAHHIREGRWMHDTSIIASYIRFWFIKLGYGGNPKQYSYWPADSLLQYLYVVGIKQQNKAFNGTNTNYIDDHGLISELFDDLGKNYLSYLTTNYDRSKGLFYNVDLRDGMEGSIGGLVQQSYRPTLNSYMYGELSALSKLSYLQGLESKYLEYLTAANQLKKSMDKHLWDEKASFYKVLPRFGPKGNKTAPVELVTTRELHGYTPWYFNLPGNDKSGAWSQLMDTQGFYAPYGLTTAEQRSPLFKIDYNKRHECLWNGPSWPYATSITLTAYSNYIFSNKYTKDDSTKKCASNFYDVFRVYATSHRRVAEDSKKLVCWLDENLNPFTGEWLAREMLKTWRNGTWDPAKGGEERGKDYNHSTFIDLVITALLGVRPTYKNVLIFNPFIIVSATSWDYFCLDNLLYHGKYITVLYDKSGKHYMKRPGLSVYVNGKLVHNSDKLKRIMIDLH